jgi:hypothetical protein
VGVRRIDLPSHSSFKHERAVSAELDLEIGFALVVICVAKMPPRSVLKDAGQFGGYEIGNIRGK